MSVVADEEEQVLLASASSKTAPSVKSPHNEVNEQDKAQSFLQTDCFPWVPARYVIVIIGALGFVNVYALRVNLSMAIVRMVNSSANHSTHLV